ncbi:TOTE conflict system archaeo-eukaryotic primase domain-containing protein [Fontibacillus panacisegetis]|uniref:TOTE conflict system archaeo-eukaryotic primase domain-containing protein n=1 Tax=Fontibacillus solani TaxID=1572857 RepID=UPI0035E3FFBE
MSYFRGREDVYPIRWTNKQGKSGYSPVCANEWTSVCEKPRVKCSVCKHQKFMPLTKRSAVSPFRCKAGQNDWHISNAAR